MHAFRLACVAFALLCLSLPAGAQPDQSVNQSDTLSSNGDSFVVNVRGMASLRIQTRDTYSGTWEVQCSLDGTTYDTDDEVNLFLEGASAGAVQEVTDTVGIWAANVAGCTHIKIISTAGFAATDTVVAVSAIASGGSSGGASSVTADTELPAAAALADNTANPTVPGVAAFMHVWDSANWDRWTGIVTAAGAYANDADAAGTNRLPTLPVITETSAPTRTNGRNAALSGTAGGSIRVMIADAAGAAVTVATDVTEDAAETAGGTGPMVMSVRRDTAASSAGTTGDNASFNTDSIGRLWTSGAVVEDAAETAADALISVGTVRRDAPASSAGTTGDNATVNTSALGAVYVAHIDPCSYKAKSYYVVNLAATGTVEVANAVAAEFWYICSVNLVAQGANAFLIAHDDTDGCGSITAGMNGGTTAATGWGFAANGGIALGNGSSTVLKSATANHYLCIAPSTTAQISGTISYVSAP